jgi:hypothetical protein
MSDALKPFQPAFDTPRTADEALAMFEAWGDPSTKTFAHSRAAIGARLIHEWIQELLTLQAKTHKVIDEIQTAQSQAQPVHQWPPLPEPDTTHYAPFAGASVRYHSVDQIIEFANARVAAAIAQQQAPQSSPVVPEGWKLVPIDLNAVTNMGWAYLDAAREVSPNTSWSFSPAGFLAALAAAPSAPVEAKEQILDAALKLSVSVSGVGRVWDNSKALLVYFNGDPTNDDVRILHDALQSKPAIVLTQACNGQTCDHCEPEHGCKLNKAAQFLHQWRRKFPGAPWNDASEKVAYLRVDDNYEARTLYTAPPSMEQVIAATLRKAACIARDYPFSPAVGKAISEEILKAAQE